MARKRDGGVMGFDPLAWMKEPGPEPKASAEHGAPGTEEEAETSGRATPHSTDESPSVVPLGEALTIEQAATLHSVLCPQLAAKCVTLEAGALTRVDAAGLQLLAAFMREADGRGMAVEWSGPPPLLHEAARQLGLGKALHLS